MVKMTDQNLELQQAYDFCNESNAVYKLLSSLSDSDYEEKTQFKGWNFNNVIGHLQYGIMPQIYLFKTVMIGKTLPTARLKCLGKVQR